MTLRSRKSTITKPQNHCETFASNYTIRILPHCSDLLPPKQGAGCWSSCGTYCWRRRQRKTASHQSASIISDPETIVWNQIFDMVFL